MNSFANSGDVIVNQRSSINPDMVVDDIMRKWPATVIVVLRHKMLCVGCPIGAFHTVTEACREHQIDVARFMADLESVVGAEQ